MTTTSKERFRFYRRWMWANGWSEMVGLGMTAFLGWLISRTQGGLPSVRETIFGAVGLIVAGTLFEGLLVGLVQATVLRQLIPSLSSSRWVRLTAIGAGLAWTAGMVPSTIASINASTLPGGTNTPPFEGTMVFVIAAAMGIVLGPFLGIPQWFELRRHVSRAGWWIVANSVAWAVGMVIVFAGATAPNEHTPIALVIPIIVATCLGAGLVVGAVHGLFLLWLTRERRELEASAKWNGQTTSKTSSLAGNRY